MAFWPITQGLKDSEARSKFSCYALNKFNLFSPNHFALTCLIYVERRNYKWGNFEKRKTLEFVKGPTLSAGKAKRSHAMKQEEYYAFFEQIV